MIKYFSYEDIPGKNYYMLKVDHTKLPPVHNFHGSYNVLPAHLLGLSYADFLRMCRDRFGAVLYGKNQKYPIATFSKENCHKELLEILNERTEEILKTIEIK